MCSKHLNYNVFVLSQNKQAMALDVKRKISLRPNTPKEVKSESLLVR